MKKELSIEEKAQRFDEVLEGILEILSSGQYYIKMSRLQQRLRGIFPELGENRDEKIKEWLVEMVEEVRKMNPTNADHNGKCSNAIAWIKKQEEQKPINKIKPEFHEDEKIRKALLSILRSDFEKDTTIFGISIGQIIDWPENLGNINKASHKIAEKENNVVEGKNVLTAYGKYVDECLNEAIKHFYSDGEDTYSDAELFYAGVRCGQSWFGKKYEQASSQTNERAWLYLVSDVLTWKDGIGQYLDNPRVQELAKKLCKEYAQKLYTSPVLPNSSNTRKNVKKPVWTENDRTMAFTLLRDVDQMTYISKEGKNERLNWLNSLEEKFTGNDSKVEPKFIAGQRIRNRKREMPAFVIDRIENDSYKGKNGESVSVAFQDDWELVEQSPIEWSAEDQRNIQDLESIIDEVWHNQKVRELLDHSEEELESLWQWIDKIWQKHILRTSRS